MYLLFYLLIFCFTIYSFELKSNRQFVISFLLFFLCLLFFGLRWRSGADYDGYLDIYFRTPLLDNFSLDTINGIHGEIGFLALISTFKFASVPDFIYMFFLSFLSLSLKFYFFNKECKMPVFAVLCYIFLFSMLYEFVQIRYALALGFVLLAISFYVSRQYKFSLFLFALAACFHYFSLVFLVIYLSRFSCQYWLCYFLSIILFYFFSHTDPAAAILLLSDVIGVNIPLFTRLLGYLSGEDHYSAALSFSSVLVLRFYFIALLILLAHSFFEVKNSRFNNYVAILMLGLVLSSVISFNSILFSRFVNLFEILEVLLIANLVSMLTCKITKVTLGLVMLVFYSFFYFNSINSENIYEYQVWFDMLL